MNNRIKRFGELKTYEVIIETSPDGAGTFRIRVESENRSEARKLGMDWLKKNRPHLIDRAQFIIDEVE